MAANKMFLTGTDKALSDIKEACHKVEHMFTTTGPNMLAWEQGPLISVKVPCKSETMTIMSYLNRAACKYSQCG